MAKATLPLLAMFALSIPAAASAEVLRADLRGEAVEFIKVGHKEKHRGKGHGKHHGKHHGWDRGWDRGYRDEGRAYEQGYRDGQREAYRRFSRGERLPYEYRDNVFYGYEDYGYPPPPYGSHYVRVGGDTYLMQAATGLILRAFLGGGY
ncbi:MAG: RcnB family protein [Pseudomonadota bacterium]|nr:RcnB family protein [Pseudomonadota bacterium]